MNGPVWAEEASGFRAAREWRRLDAAARSPSYCVRCVVSRALRCVAKCTGKRALAELIDGVDMPKIDLAAVPEIQGTGYPPPHDAPCAERIRQRLGEAGGLFDFGVNLMRLPPGNWSSQRHWHSAEDEFVYVLEGEPTLVEDEGETLLRAGDCAAFRKNSGNGHHMINRSNVTAMYLEVGSRSAADVTTCADIDTMSPSSDGRFLHKDGTPYPGA
jgi:uncharacterized cupin superfamily protein